MNKKFLLIACLSIANIFFHLAFFNNLEFHRDEMFYYVYGNHLAAGYATTPPLIGVLSFFLINIFGYSLFAVRLLPALLSGAMVFVVAEMTKELKGKPEAQIMAALAFIIAPFAMRTYFLYMPVFLDVFFWSLIFLFLLKYINRKEPCYLLLMGIAAGLGMLNKYLIALLIFLILLFILFTRNKDIFRKRPFYFGLAAGFLLFLPNLFWQAFRNFPVIHHMSELQRTQLVHVNRIDFLVDQLLMPFQSSLFIVAGLLFLFNGRTTKNYRIIGWISVSVIVILLAMRGKSYYTIGIFPVLIAAGAVYWDNLIKSKLIKTGFMLLLIAISYLVLPVNLPVFKPDKLAGYFRVMHEKTGLTVGRRFEDGTIHSLPQDYADMIGWNELVEVTNQAYQKVQNKESCMVYCENYGQASAVEVIGEKFNLPIPLSFHDSYLQWLPDSLNTEITEVIYINDELGDDVAELFADVEKIGEISNRDAREFGTSVFLCQKPRRSFNQFWYLRVKQIKSEQN